MGQLWDNGTTSEKMAVRYIMGLARQKNLFESDKLPESGGAGLFREAEPNGSPLTLLQRIEQQALRQLKIESPAVAEMAAKVIIDPGADISPEDSEMWLWLFAAAEKDDMELYARLFYIRGAGARLERRATHGYSIKPVIDPEGKKGWASLAEYQQERQCLVAYREKLIGLLQGL